MIWPWGWVIVISCICVWILILAGVGFLIFRKVTDFLLEEIKNKKLREER